MNTPSECYNAVHCTTPAALAMGGLLDGSSGSSPAFRAGPASLGSPRVNVLASLVK